MKLKLILPLILLVHMASGQEMDRDHSRLSILAGIQQSYLLDQQFSSLVYQANEISSQIRYDVKWNRSNAYVSLDAATGNLDPTRFKGRTIYNTTEDIHGHIITDSTFITGNTRTATIAFGYTYDVVHQSTFEISLGGIARNQVMYPSTFTNLGILNSASLLAAAEMHWYPGTLHELRAGISVPVIGYNTRFPYSGTLSHPNQGLFEAFFDGGTSLVTLDTYQQLNFNLGYRYDVSAHTSIGIQYDFMWQYYSLPVPLTTYSNRIGAVIDFNF